MSLGISSVKIGGVSYSALLKDFEIALDISNRIGMATLWLTGAPGSIALAPLQAVEVKDSTSTLIFAGTVSQIEPTVLEADSSGAGLTKYKVTCRDYATLLDQAIITGNLSYGGVTDQSIVQSLLSTFVPGIGGTHVSSTTMVDIITFENISVRQALEKLIQLTGCEFYVDVNKNLQYHSPSSTAAPWSLAEPANNSTSFAPIRKTLQYTNDFSNPANYVFVIGAVGTGGTIFAATVQNAGSQGTYGVIKRTIIDRSLQSNAACTARGNVELANYATPQISGTFSIKKSGLMVGQYLPITIPSMGISGSFLVRKVTAKWMGTTQPTYTVEFGQYRPDLAKALRMLATQPPDQPYTPVSTIPSGLISIADFAASVRPVAIVTSLPTLPDTNYPSGSTVVLTSDGLLYRNSSGTWTKVVNTTDLQGTVSAAQIAANAIVAGKIAANAVTAGTIAAGVIVGTMISATAAITQTNIGGSGVVTDITQLVDSSLGGGFYTGLQVRTNSGASPRASIGPSAIGLVNSSNQAAALLSAAVGNGLLQLYSSGSQTIEISASPAAAVAFGSGTQSSGIRGSGHFGTAGSHYIVNSSAVTAAALEADASGFGAVCFDNYSTFAMRCSTNRTRAIFGFNQLSSGQYAFTTGFGTTLGVFAQLADSGLTPTEYLNVWGSTIYSSNPSSSKFVFWAAFGF